VAVATVDRGRKGKASQRGGGNEDEDVSGSQDGTQAGARVCFLDERPSLVMGSTRPSVREFCATSV
jgi:hypothetical protein